MRAIRAASATRSFVSVALVAVAIVTSGGGLAAQGLSGGIRIHGHWVIEVRNPDGSLATRREFDNALTPRGAETLARVLSGNGAPTSWIVVLGNAEANLCDGICSISQVPGFGRFATLTVTPAGSQITLSGNVPSIPGSGSLGYVSTLLDACGPAVSREQCSQFTPPQVAVFTTHTLADANGNATPIALQQGQLVLLTVTFTFSS